MHRAAILGLLAGRYAPAGDTDVGYVLSERLGVADGLGMPTHPGSPAWLIAAGEAMGVATPGVNALDTTHIVCDTPP